MYANTWIRVCLSTLLLVKMDTLASKAGKENRSSKPTFSRSEISKTLKSDAVSNSLSKRTYVFSTNLYSDIEFRSYDNSL